MSEPIPLLDEPPRLRRDAARNRERVLEAALAIIDECGVAAVTMDAVAARAGVGKGTLFRGFRSRSGLMGAVLDLSETEWQREVMGGPPPLGPGAPPMERIVAFGESRMRLNVTHAQLIEAIGNEALGRLGPMSFTTMHVRYLLSELGVEGDLTYLATALVAALELIVVRQLVDLENEDLARLAAGWADLVRRVVSG